MKNAPSLPPILTIGAAVRDIFVRSTVFESRHDQNAPDGFDACFPLGAKIPLEDILFETGGGATNAAVTFSRFGFHTRCVARIGKDTNGQAIREALEKEGVHTDHLQTDKKLPTGASIILLSGAGYRTILTHRGAAEHVEHVDLPWKKGETWIYLTSLGESSETLFEIFREAKKQKAHIAWNPGNAEIRLGLKKLHPLLAQTDILLMNRQEAASLVDVAPRHLDDILHRVSIYPRQAFCMTDGEHGAYVHSHGRIWHADATKAKRRNTTGAGDAFGSAFVAGALRTGNFETGLRMGTLNASGVISHMGAKAGILKKPPTLTECRRIHVTSSSFSS